MSNEKHKQLKTNSFLVFKMINEYFAINVGKVISILEMQKITEVPEAPAYMKGVINLRGEVLPVVDSHIKFGFNKPIEITMHTGILVLEVISDKEEIIRLGLIVDLVEEVIQIQPKDILPPPGIGSTYQSRYITGMFQKNNKDFIMILNIDKILTVDEIGKLIVTGENNEQKVV